MSDQFNIQLVRDKRLDAKSRIGFGVYKGAQTALQSRYQATSQNTSSIIFNIQVPSENVLVQREVLFTSTLTFQLTYLNTNGVVGTPSYMVQYGRSEAFCPFPLQSCMSNISVTINTTTVSVPMQDIIQLILRMMDIEEINYYANGTPAMLDFYNTYLVGSTLIQANQNNPLGSIANYSGMQNLPRGSFAVNYIGNTDPNGNSPANSYLQAATVVYVQATFTEPLLVSPFTWGKHWNDPGIHGVQTMNLQFNIGALNKIFKSEIYNYTTVLTNVKNSSLDFTFLTPHPSDLLSAKNTVPYYQIVPYKTAYNNVLALNSTAVIPSNNFQLSTVPDKLFVGLRPTIGAYVNTMADYYALINSVNIQWNANSGILSSATPYQLWEMTRESGCKMSWLEWSGYFCMFVAPTSGAYNTSFAIGGLQGTIGGPSQGGPGGNGVPYGCGALLVLDYARFITITEDFFAPASIGQFSLQVQLTVQGNGVSSIASTLANYELVVAVMNSGVFSTERGSSQVYLNILSKQDVLNASTQPAMYDSDLYRMVGGNFLSSLKSAVGDIYSGIKSIAPVASEVLGAIPDPRAQLASNVLKKISGNGRMTLEERMMAQK